MTSPPVRTLGRPAPRHSPPLSAAAKPPKARPLSAPWRKSRAPSAFSIPRAAPAPSSSAPSSASASTGRRGSPLTRRPEESALLARSRHRRRPPHRRSQAPHPARQIYGVDLDAQAVEVTQLSLYLKMLEGETHDTLSARARTPSRAGHRPPPAARSKHQTRQLPHRFRLLPRPRRPPSRPRPPDWDVQFRNIMRAAGSTQSWESPASAYYSHTIPRIGVATISASITWQLVSEWGLLIMSAKEAFRFSTTKRWKTRAHSFHYDLERRVSDPCAAG